MKSMLATLLAALSLVAALASAQQPRATAPDAEHQLLHSVAGQWNVTQSLWLTPGKPPKVDQGKASLDMVLNGRHLRQNLQIADGTGFEGLGYFGYDSTTRQFFSTWMDVNFPGLVVAYGSFDPTAKAVTLRGRMPAAQGGDAVLVREVLTLTDPDHLRYEFFETHKGIEALAVRLDYTRVR